MAEPPSPVPWRGSPPPEGELEEMINQGSARIHLNSWLAYSKKRGWYSKEKEPPCSHPVDGVFPPRLVIYGEKGEKHSKNGPLGRFSWKRGKNFYRPTWERIGNYSFKTINGM